MSNRQFTIALCLQKYNLFPAQHWISSRYYNLYLDLVNCVMVAWKGPYTTRSFFLIQCNMKLAYNILRHWYIPSYVSIKSMISTYEKSSLRGDTLQRGFDTDPLTICIQSSIRIGSVPTNECEYQAHIWWFFFKFNRIPDDTNVLDNFPTHVTWHAYI